METPSVFLLKKKQRLAATDNVQTCEYNSCKHKEKYITGRLLVDCGMF